MSYNPFVHSTMTDAETIIDNFYHIGQGNIMPMRYSTLSLVDDREALGSTSRRWKNVYCNDIYISGPIQANDNIFLEIYNTTFTSTASDFNVTGLNGDGDKYYIILIDYHTTHYTTTTIPLYVSLQFNYDTSSLYGRQSFEGGAITHDGITSAFLGSMAQIFLVEPVAILSDTTQHVISESIVCAQTKTPRYVFTRKNGGSENNAVYGSIYQAGTWDNWYTTITSMNFKFLGGNTITNTSIKIYKQA